MSIVRRTQPAPTFLNYSLIILCHRQFNVGMESKWITVKLVLPQSSFFWGGGVCVFDCFVDGCKWITDCIHVWLPCCNTVLLFPQVTVQWIALFHAALCQTSQFEWWQPVFGRLLAHSHPKTVLLCAFVWGFFCLCAFCFCITLLTNIYMVIVNDIT